MSVASTSAAADSSEADALYGCGGSGPKLVQPLFSRTNYDPKMQLLTAFRSIKCSAFLPGCWFCGNGANMHGNTCKYKNPLFCGQTIS
jgi:hypothetical protein